MERKTLPNDERAQAAQKIAEAEVEKLNRYLATMGQARVSFLEKPALITYIKCRELGLLDG